MIQDVFIIGATGNVGKTLVSQILDEGDLNRQPIPTRIVGLASATNFIYSPLGLDAVVATGFAKRFYFGNGMESNPYKSHDELLSAVGLATRDTPTQLVFVDVTPLKNEMTNFHLEVINYTPYNIVTANKNPISLSDYSTFEMLTHDVRRYGYKCSVMAGAHAVPIVQELRDLNDVPRLIEGCFSGTLGYITSELQKGEGSFSEILAAARSEHYTEPHPRDDLSGLDVARKLIVLARTAGYRVELKDINLEPFIPNEYLAEDDISRFMSSTTRLDSHFSERMKSLKDQGKTLRYVASMDATEFPVKLGVRLSEVPLESSLGSLEGTLNKIIIVSKVHPREKPYEISSQGAGPDVTAQNIRSDLLALLPKRYANANQLQLRT